MNVLPNCPSRKAMIITLLCNISETERLRFFTRNYHSLMYLALICNEAASSALLVYKLNVGSGWSMHTDGLPLGEVDVPADQKMLLLTS